MIRIQLASLIPNISNIPKNWNADIANIAGHLFDCLLTLLCFFTALLSFAADHLAMLHFLDKFNVFEVWTNF